jgi:iron complex outermembrane receptor protein
MFTPAIRRLLGLSGLLSLAAAPVQVKAQSAGAVRGTVRATGSAAPLSGATVSIAAPARAVLTGENGQFTLRNLPAGRYDVVATAVGRTPQHQTVTVTAGGTATADFALAPGSILLPG